ncbi:MAG: polysaccharide biosynthesis tyrosine autokinase [Acetobacteraceae bacterium]|jgi:capsular exopolysaccharide synthesis family protein
MNSASGDLFGISSALLRRKWVILSCGVVGALVSLGIARVMPLQYASEGDMIVDSRAPNVPELNIGAGAPQAGGPDVATQVDVLRSEGLIERVVHRLNLTRLDELQPTPRVPEGVANLFFAVQSYINPYVGLLVGEHRKVDAAHSVVDYIQRHLQLDTSDRSAVIGVRFQAANPDIAAAVINTAMSEYLSTEIDARSSQTSQINTWLSGRVAEMAKEVDAADRQVQDFMQNHNMQQVQGSSATALQLSKDRDQLVAARQELIRRQQSLDAVKQAVARGHGATTAQQILASPTIQSLKQREIQLVQRIAVMAPSFPERVDSEAELRSVRAQIKAETDHIVAGMAVDTEIAAANVKMLAAAVENDSTQARDSSVGQETLTSLTREAAAKREMYLALLTRAEQTKLTAAQFPSMRVLFAATPALEPVQSSRMAALILGFLGGGLLAGSTVLLRRALSDTVRSRSDMEIATGMPVFGCLPKVKMSSPRDITSLEAGHVLPMIDESLRAMWLSMRSLTTPGAGTMALITSSEVGEGKTTVAAAFARRVAADGFRVLLIDADLRHPSLSAAWRDRPVGSLEAVLTGAIKFERAVLRDSRSGVNLLLAEGNNDNPTKLLASEEFKALLASKRDAYDLVIIDSPPVLRVADAILISKLCPLTLLVVESGRLSGKQIAEAIRRFPEQERGKILTLLTQVRPRHLEWGDYYGGYGPASAGRMPLSLQHE